MVLSVSLHHQRCDNFCKMQQENAKWSGASIDIRHFTVSFPPGAPCKCVYYTSVRARGPCPQRKGWCFGSIGLAHSENPPLHQRHLKIMNCWTLDRCMLGSPVAGVTPLARLQNLPRPQRNCLSRPLLHHFHCPKPVQIFGLGTGTRLSWLALS